MNYWFDGYDYPTLTASKATIHQPTVILREDMLRVSHTARIDSFVKLECGDGIVLGNYVHIASFSHIGVGGGGLIMEDGSGHASHVVLITGSNIPGRGRSTSAVAPDS